MPTVATVPVYDYINDSSGNPIPNADVYVTLNFNQATSASPVTNIEAVQQKVTTDPTGTWTVNVVPVNKLSPSGCLYNVRTPYQSYDINPTDVNVPVGPPAGWQSSSILVVVPPGLGPTLPNFNVSGILTAGSIQVTAGEPGIDTVGAGVLEIGGDNATTVEIGPKGVLVDANGNVAAGSFTASATSPYVPIAGSGGGYFSGNVTVGGSIGLASTIAVGTFITALSVAVPSTSTAGTGGSGGSHGPFVLVLDDSNFFVNTYDPVMYLGYNAAALGTKVVAAEPYCVFVVEGDYNDGVKHTVEQYVEYKSPDGTQSFRPIMFQYDRSQTGVGNINAALALSQFEGNPLKIQLPDGTLMVNIAKDNYSFLASGAANATFLNVAAAAGQSASLSLGYNAVGNVFQLFPANATLGRFVVGGRTIAEMYSTPNGGAGQAFAVGASDNSAVGVFAVGTSDVGVKGLVARGKALQTANLFEAQDENSAAHVYITAGHSTKLASLVVGKAALATNATDGFLYIPSMAGAPTGVPTARTGTVALVYDTTNDKLMVYDTADSAWEGTVLA